MLDLHEILELENKWNEYQAKKTRKKRLIILAFLFAVFLILVAALSYFFYNKGASELKESVKQNNEQTKQFIDEQKIKYEKEKILKKQKQTKAVKETEKSKETKKEPIKEEVKKEEIIEEKQKDEVKQEENLTEEKPKEIKSKKNKLMPILILNEIAITSGKKYNRQNVEPNIIRSRFPQEIVIKDAKTTTNDKTNDINYLESKYNETNSVYFAIDLAEAYYNKADYKNARKWALVANKQNASNERTWIVFAKSSYKLGLKEQAIESLNNYLRSKDSDNVANTLELIIKGQL